MRNHIVAVALIGAVLFTGCSGNNARKEQTPSSSPSVSATVSTSTFASPTASVTPSLTPTPTTSPTISEVTPEPAATADAEQHEDVVEVPLDDASTSTPQPEAAQQPSPVQQQQDPVQQQPVAPVPAQTSAQQRHIAPVPEQPAPVNNGGGVYYKNCAAVRAAGAAPLYRGQPGYGTHLDSDGDGIACEPKRNKS